MRHLYNYRKTYGKAGPLREALYEEGRSLREGRSLQGPLRADRLTGRPLTGRLLTRRPLTNYRKAYRKRRGGTLPELGGNFRLCAVDQKRPFFPRAGPFLDLLPFKGPFSLTGALTGPPYGKAPYGEASYGKAGPFPYEEGRSLREGPGPVRVLHRTEKDDEEAYGKAPYGEASYEKAPYELQESLQEATGRDFTRIGQEFPLVCRRPKKGRFFLGLGRFWTFCPLRDLSPLQGPLRDRLTRRPLTGRLLTGRLGPYRKPLTRRDGPYGKGRGPVRVLHREGRRRGLREGRALTGSPLRGGTVLTRRAGPLWKGRGPLRVLHREGYGKAGPLREAPWPLRADRLTGRLLTGRLLTERPLTGRFLETPLITGKLGPYGKPLTRRDGPYGKGRSLQGPLRADRLTGRPLTGRLLTRRLLTNYRKAYGKLRGETLPELDGNFRLCAVDQKRSFFPRAGPFLDLLPFKGPFSLTGALTGPPYGKAPYGEASYEKAPYELQESLREATGRAFTRIGREFPLVRRRPKKVVFSQGCAVSGPSALSGTFPSYSLLPPFPLTGTLTGRPPYGKAPYGEASYEKALTNYRKAYGKLRGETLPELGGNFRLCAVDQKKAVFS